MPGALLTSEGEVCDLSPPLIDRLMIAAGAIELSR